MYSRVANDAPSSRTDHPERTTRRLCRTPQPTLSSTSAVAGSDRAESTLGSRPPAPRAVDRSTASTAPTHDRRQGVQPGIRAVSERASNARALPARPPQVSSEPSPRYTRTAATADGSSLGDDSVTQGTSYFSFPLSAAAEDDVRSYTRRATYSSTEGGARVHPPITHPRGMEGVRSQSRTSPHAYVHAPCAVHVAYELEPAADALQAGEQRARRVVTTRPATFTTSRAPSVQEGDAPIRPLGTPHGQLHDAAGRDLKSRVRRALYSATEGGAHAHPSSTHPRGVEGVLPQLRTPRGAFGRISGDSRFESEPTAVDDAHTGERQAGGPTAAVARPHYHALTEREARVDTLPAWQRIDVNEPTSCIASSTARTRAPSQQVDDAHSSAGTPTPRSPLYDAAGRDQMSFTRRALQSATEDGARIHLSNPRPRRVEGVSTQSRTHAIAPLAISSTLGRFKTSFGPVPSTDEPCAGRPLQDHRAYSSTPRNAVDVPSVAYSIGATIRSVYDTGKKYISYFSSDVVSVARDLSHRLAATQCDERGGSVLSPLPVSLPASPGVPCASALSLCRPPAPWTAPPLYSADAVHCTGNLKSASPRDTGDDGDLDHRGHNVRRPSNGLPLLPYVVETYTTGLFPSVVDIAPRDNERSNPRGCDMSIKFESSPLSAAKNTIRSTSQRTPALEGGAGVLLPKSHPLAMEGASAEDVLPAYAETSAPGQNSRFALESRMPYTTAKVPSEKHLKGAGPKDKSAFLNAATEQWARNVSPIAVHMFSRAAENLAARAVLEKLQGGSQRVRSTPLPPHVTQPSAVSISSGRAGRGRSFARTAGRDDQSASSRELDASHYERRARALRNAKLPMPTYDGTADLRRYEEFVFKWDSWIRNKGLGESDAVELMYNALTGEALEWYLSFVAMSDYPWTAREIYQELYEYCFPSNFREELRIQLMSAKQDGRPVKQFAKDLQNLAQRFSDIGQSTLKRVLWDGVDPYIRIFWVEKGRSAEYDDYDTLVLYAHRAERREAEIRRCLDLEDAEVETELSPRRDNNPDRGVTAHAVRMRQIALQPEEQPVPMEHEEPEYSEGEQEYYSEEPSPGNNEEELEEDIEAEGGYPQQFDDEYEEGEEEYYYSQDESESREHESQYSQGDYYENEYEEYGEAEEQPNEYGDEETYSEGGMDRDGEGDNYYEEEGEEEGEYYDDEAGDEDEEDEHGGVPPLNTGRNEYGEDEYNSEGSLYEDEEEY